VLFVSEFLPSGVEIVLQEDMKAKKAAHCVVDAAIVDCCSKIEGSEQPLGEATSKYKVIGCYRRFSDEHASCCRLEA